MRGFQKDGDHFSEQKRRLRQRNHKLRASKNMGAIFLKKKAPVATYSTHKLGASQNMGAIFLEKKKRLRQRTHKLGASRNMGAIFLRKKKRLRQRSQTYGASKNMGPGFDPWATQDATGRLGLPACLGISRRVGRTWLACQ